MSVCHCHAIAIAITIAIVIIPEPMNPSEHLGLQTKQSLLPDNGCNDDEDYGQCADNKDFWVKWIGHGYISAQKGDISLPGRGQICR